MTTSLINQTDNTAKELLQALASFDEEQINKIPFEGSWTAGQVAEHILKSASGAVAMLNGDTKPAGRPAEEKVGALRDLFLNFETKMSSPDFVLPADPEHNKEELISALQRTMQDASLAAATKDLSGICVGFEFPGFGELTRLEWLSFMLFHTQRHTRQLKNILHKLAAN